MDIRLYGAVREGLYYYTGYIPLLELAELVKEYPFESEVLEKAEIHQRSMETAFTGVSMTLRVEPGCEIICEEDCIVFRECRFELRDGRSKAAALSGLKEDMLLSYGAGVKVFLVDSGQMEKLEKNYL